MGGSMIPCVLRLHQRVIFGELSVHDDPHSHKRIQGTFKISPTPLLVEKASMQSVIAYTASHFSDLKIHSNKGTKGFMGL